MNDYSYLSVDNPYSHLAQQFLKALLGGQRDTATWLILDSVERGMTVKEIYLNVFQNTQREIGRLWETNQVTVAQEHYCTAATQMIMAQLYPYIFNTTRVGKRIVATCVSGELHEIGMRMVADFFELEGWDTYYIGSNTPASSIVAAIEEREADVLGISATIHFHVGAVKKLIEAVHASDAGRDVKVLVGGYPFITTENLWQKVGADAFGRDAAEAISLANEL
ncbi:MAG: cobalamin-dependent protein [Anaerolineae bacterium]|nr:cobalamin-dependent protein [Anaerolineae bacterium]